MVFGCVAHPQDQSVTFPQFNASSTRCSTFTVWPLSHDEMKLKGLNAKGQPAGMFMAVGDDGAAIVPTSGSTIVVTEGVKDASTLHGIGFQAIGLSGKYIKTEWLPMFQGFNVVLCLDNDAAGREAQEKLAANEAGKVAGVPG